MIRTTTVGVTGATGKVGRALVLRLREAGYRTLAFSRSGRLDGSHDDTLDYSDLDAKFARCDVIVHLAALNNDAAVHDVAAFRAANVEFARDLASISVKAGVRKFINLSTVHALDPIRTDPYSVSKREAVEALRGVEGLRLSNIYASRVYGLDGAPSGIAGLFWRIAPALQPCIGFDQLADHVIAEIESDTCTDEIVSHPAGTSVLYRWAKRTIDIAFVLSVTLLFWWLLMLVWLAVKLTSPGPGIFAQTRVGKDGAPFTCYKFRTMGADTKSVATHEVAAASVTPLGKFLRASKIDELPQIVNLLRGEMTLIGPRPCLPQQEELIRERRDRGVYTITPGISGFAQVNGIDMSNPVRLAQQDAIYLRTQSLIGDVKLLLRTLVGGGSGDKVRA
jgi:lipopolysaccharide/colanic/teichoic acid biosynthesis glycosyltransferase